MLFHEEDEIWWVCEQAIPYYSSKDRKNYRELL